MKDRTNQRGQQLAYFGIFALVLFALAALAIDAGRLFFVAREAQTVADAAALAGAVALARPGGDDALAVLAAQGVALQNSVDNTLATVIAADIVVGRWSGGAFTTVTPHNAVKTTWLHYQQYLRSLVAHEPHTARGYRRLRDDRSGCARHTDC